MIHYFFIFLPFKTFILNAIINNIVCFSVFNFKLFNRACNTFCFAIIALNCNVVNKLMRFKNYLYDMQ